MAFESSHPHFIVLDSLWTETSEKEDSANKACGTNDENSRATNGSEKETGKQKKQVVSILQPPFEATKVDGYHVLSFDMPGVKSDGVSLDLDGEVLKLSAERKQSDGRIIQFKKTLQLDERFVDTSRMQAALNDGVLTVLVPTKKALESATVQVLTSEPPEPKDTDKMQKWSIDLPGVKATDLRVSIANDKLTVDAERKRHGQEPVKFSRTFVLDYKCFDLAKMEAFLCNGVLTFVVPELEDTATETPKKHVPVGSSPLQVPGAVVDLQAS